MPVATSPLTHTATNALDGLVLNGTDDARTLRIASLALANVEKLTDDSPEVNVEIGMAVAVAFVRTYKGTFSYILDMQAKANLVKVWYPSIGQIRGILNTMRAEGIKLMRDVKVAPATIAAATVPVYFDEVKAPITIAGNVLHNGMYTVEHTDGTHTTVKIFESDSFRAKVNGEKGLRFAGFLHGADNENDYTMCAFVKADGRINLFKRFNLNTKLAHALDVLANPEDAMLAGEQYAMESGQCWKCGRTLTVPTSISRGLGPVCYAKVTGQTLDGDWKD